MHNHRWLAFGLITVWIGQLINLWPLPSEITAQMAAGANAQDSAAIAQYESTLWLSWIIRALAVPLGIASGMLLLKNHRNWPIVLLVTGLACLAILQPWQWLSIYAPLLGDRAVDRVSWLLGQPRLIFNTVVFPVILVVSVVIAAIHLIRRQADVHAI